MSETSRVQARYVEESAWGTTPASAMTNFRIVGESLKFAADTIASSEIRSDRQIPDLIRTALRSQGGVNFELSFATFDPFFESALYSTLGAALTVTDTDISAANADSSFNAVGGDFPAFVKGQWIKVSGFTGDTTNNGYKRISSTVAPTTSKIIVNETLVDDAVGESVTIAGQRLVNGTTRKSFTIEKEMTDITQFLIYRGMVVSSLNLNTEAEGIIGGSFDFLGKNATRDISTAGTGGPTVANANSVMNAGDHISNILIGGTAPTATEFVTAVNISLDNNLRARPAIANIAAVDVKAGRVNVTGSFSLYFATGTHYDLFLNDTATSLSWLMDDGTNSYMLTLPNVKISDSDIVAGGPDADVLAVFPFQAIRDANTDVTIQIDKF